MRMDRRGGEGDVEKVKRRCGGGDEVTRKRGEEKGEGKGEGNGEGYGEGKGE